MSQSADAELELFRQGVNCAAVLERMAGGWRLDVRESTRRALKYRRGEGEIIIVNHDGRGWWDATEGIASVVMQTTLRENVLGL